MTVPTYTATSGQTTAAEADRSATDQEINESVATLARRATTRDYAILLKPRVMSLVVFTGLVGLVLAPGSIPLWQAVMAIALIALGAGASGAINMWYDRDIDAHMARTKNRPIPAGRMEPDSALVYGTVLAALSVLAMGLTVNWMAAGLLAFTIFFYVVIYTIWLKRRTPQNIVIGGASGALPPVVGWAAVTGTVSIEPIILFAIIFAWTPPHFWALALFRAGDYENAGVPMLPVVSGIKETKRQILIYSLLLVPITLLPTLVGLSGWLYFALASVLGVMLIGHAIRVKNCKTDGEDWPRLPRKMFFFTILYLFVIFLGLLADRGLMVLMGA
ncbi:MAG: heme o synthase [Magnetovibrionaceae bacterium]